VCSLFCPLTANSKIATKEGCRSAHSAQRRYADDIRTADTADADDHTASSFVQRPQQRSSQFHIGRTKSIRKHFCWTVRATTHTEPRACGATGAE